VGDVWNFAQAKGSTHSAVQRVESRNRAINQAKRYLLTRPVDIRASLPSRHNPHRSRRALRQRSDHPTRDRRPAHRRRAGGECTPDGEYAWYERGVRGRGDVVSLLDSRRSSFRFPDHEPRRCDRPTPSAATDEANVVRPRRPRRELGVYESEFESART